MKDLLRISFVCAIISLGTTYLLSTFDDDTHTSMFCAYGKVFVTFKQDRSIWGTILLDEKGMPIPCNDPDLKKQDSINFKGTI